MTDNDHHSEDHQPLEWLDRRLAQEASEFHAPQGLTERIVHATAHHLPVPAPLPFASASGEQDAAAGWMSTIGRLAVAACLALVVVVGIWAFWPKAVATQMEPSRIIEAHLAGGADQATMLSPAVERLLVESDPVLGTQVAAMLDARDATWCGVSGELRLLANGMQTSDVHRLNVDIY